MAETSIRALSVRQPWPWAIFHAGKDVENRSWPTRHRGRLLIHAAATVDKAAVAAARKAGWRVPGRLPCGVLVGEVWLVDCVRHARSEWAEPGQWHWLLSRPRAFGRPVPWTGARRLFTVPADALGREAVR